MILSASPYFDREWYIRQHPEVDFSRISPAEHYLTIGWRQSCDPSEYFDNDAYLRSRSGPLDQAPLIHYELHGITEGNHTAVRRPSPKKKGLRFIGAVPRFFLSLPNRVNNRVKKTAALYSKLLMLCKIAGNENRSGCYEEDIDFTSRKTEIKTIALYLPQYHEIPENNEWWGKGFTEWTNVRKARPMFPGHYQPRVPSPEIGYYTLDNQETIRRQTKLAKSHGIYGFGVYYYWFSGKRLLEKPLDIILENKDIDFPFLLIWANENWTRTWDGQEKKVLIRQEYLVDDPEHFICDIKKYLMDERYIHVDGKPVIGLYEIVDLPDWKRVLQTWRETARRIGIGEIEIWICRTGKPYAEGMTNYVDAEYSFPPRGYWGIERKPFFRESILSDYSEIVDKYLNLIEEKDIPVWGGSMLGWDNSARRKNGFHYCYNYSPVLFYKWNCKLISELRKRYASDKRFLFVNAWNEWGEGTYLEPDRKYGYANINMLSRALFDDPLPERYD